MKGYLRNLRKQCCREWLLRRKRQEKIRQRGSRGARVKEEVALEKEDDMMAKGGGHDS